jgi:hypothetical protein
LDLCSKNLCNIISMQDVLWFFDTALAIEFCFLFSMH